MFQKLANFAKFLKFEWQEGDFLKGRIPTKTEKGEKLISFIGQGGSSTSSGNEESKCRDLAHELAHYLIADKNDYKLENFGLSAPGYTEDDKDYTLDLTSCVLGAIIMNHFDINSDYIYRELVDDEFTNQSMIEEEIENLIILKFLSSDFLRSAINKPKDKKTGGLLNLKQNNLPNFFNLPKTFNIPHAVLRRQNGSICQGEFGAKI